MRAKLNYKDAAQPNPVEGFLRAALTATWLMSDHGAKIQWKDQLGGNLWTIPCVTKSEYPQKTHNFRKGNDQLFLHNCPES